jgi:hypothetical protein
MIYEMKYRESKNLFGHNFQTFNTQNKIKNNHIAPIGCNSNRVLLVRYLT